MCAYFYCLEENLSNQEETLVISVSEGMLVQEAKPIALQSAYLKVEASDQQLLEKLRKQKRLQKPPYSFIITREETLPILKLLAGTGRFYSSQGQSVICDFYNLADLRYVISAEGEQLNLSVKVVAAKREFLLHEVSLVLPGPPMWLKAGPVIYLLKQECSWKRVKLLHASPTFKIDSDWKEWLCEEERQEKLTGAVSLLLKERVKEADPTPVLILKDRVGAFADLKMNYGEGRVVPYPVDVAFKGFKRNLEAERSWEQDLLETDYVIKPVGSTRYYCPVDRVGKSLAFLLELGWKISDALGNQVLKADTIAFVGELEGDQVIIKGGVRYGDFQANLYQLTGAFNRREHFVQLGLGTIGLLPDNLDRETVCRLAEEGELVSQSYRFSKTVLPLLDEIAEVGKFEVSDSLKNFMETLHHPPEALSSFYGFTGTLRPYQQQGVGWMRSLYTNGLSGLLADEMGLGKTVQVLAFLSSLPACERSSLIVMPTSLLFNWRRELERFAPNIPYVLHHGPAREKELPQKCLVLTSYTTLRIDCELFKKTVWHCLILDEAQAIKNPESQIAQEIVQIQSQFRLSLTGTPIENRLEELWSQFRFLLPGFLGSRAKFQTRMQALATGNREMQRLKKMVAPFILRRKKDEVARDLPPKTEQELWIEMPAGQRRFYEEFLSGVKGNLFKKISQEGVDKHRMEILEAILRLRQICCHPLLAMPSSEGVESGKLQVLTEEMEVLVEEGRKVLIFSQFSSMLHLMQRDFSEKRWKTLLLDGQTGDRETLVRRFQEDSEVSLFLISLKAGGVGLNLTAADTVVLFDPWWNVAVENQAIDRAHRIGQDKPLLVKRYLMAESIEEKVYKLKESKRLLAEELFEDVPSVSAEELFALLS